MAALQSGHSDFLVKPRPSDYIKGVNSPIVFKAVSDGNWTPRIEFFENQDLQFETNGCVLFAAQESFDAQMDNLIATGAVPADMLAEFESLGYMNTGLDGNSHFHSSPRFLQIMTGNGFNGNSCPEAWDAMRKFGVLPWKDLPYDATITQAEYLTGVTQPLLDKASQFLTLIGGKDAIQYHWIQADSPKNIPAIQTAIQQSPLCLGVAVTVPGWNQVTPTDVPVTQDAQHAVMCYEVQGSDLLVLDHYPPYEKDLDAGYPVNYVLQGVLTIIAPVEQQIVSGTAQVVQEIATDTTDSAPTKDTLLDEAEKVVEALAQII